MRHIRIAMGLAALAAAAATPSMAATSCAALAQQLKLPHVTVTQAVEVPAGAFTLPADFGPPPGPPLDFTTLPAFCRLAAISRPTTDSEIRFEVWMPLTGWNGKYVGGGNGVWAGSVSYIDFIEPVSRGYAAAVSDLGHQGGALDAGFLLGHPEKLVDFGHRAAHETAVAAKATIEAFYGRGPQRSLYMSCSTGGRVGLMEAYRYPEDYDGIAATAPANGMVPLTIASLWTGYVAMKDEASRIPPPKIALVQKAALDACDANDGVKDGIINHPPSCRFNPSVLQCSGADGPQCLTVAQVDAFRGVYAGPKNPRTGRQIYPGLSVGSEAQMAALVLGREPFPVATTFFRGPVFNNPSWDFRSFDYDRDTRRALDYGQAALDVPATGLKRYFAGGRKLLLAHGWSDGLIPAQATVDFHAALAKSIGPRRAERGVRLFMAPGMGHCRGGDGPSQIDMLGAIDRWVETGQPPERLIASNLPGAPERTRPLCAHPKIARYSGSGSTDAEQSFRCEAP